MNGPSTSPVKSRRRRWWFVRLTAWLILLGWFGWGAQVRWITPPAGVHHASASDQQADLPTAALDQAIVALPQYVPSGGSSTQPRRPTWNWWAALDVGLEGAWDPNGRPELSAIVQYLSAPATQHSLDLIVAESEALRRLGRQRWNFDGSSTSSFNPWGSYGAVAAATALAVRARLRQAQDHDLAGSVHDLRAAIFQQVLVMRARSEFPVLRTAPLTGMIELVCTVQEVALPPAEGREIIAFLRDELPFGTSDALADLTVRPDRIQAWLDQYYTDDGRGNGWLVLSAMKYSRFAGPFARTNPRSPFWNIFSPLFNDRRTVAAKLAGFGAWTEGADALDYAGVLAAGEHGANLRRRVNLLDGPALATIAAADGLALPTVLRDLTWRRAAVVMVALSVYRHEHGEYPARLSELVPDPLPALPDDVLTNKPFVYNRTAADSYTLGSAGEMPSDIWPLWGTTTVRSSSRSLAAYTLKRAEAGE